MAWQAEVDQILSKDSIRDNHITMIKALESIYKEWLDTTPEFIVVNESGEHLVTSYDDVADSELIHYLLFLMEHYKNLVKQKTDKGENE